MKKSDEKIRADREEFAVELESFTSVELNRMKYFFHFLNAVSNIFVMISFFAGLFLLAITCCVWGFTDFETATSIQMITINYIISITQMSLALGFDKEIRQGNIESKWRCELFFKRLRELNAK